MAGTLAKVAKRSGRLVTEVLLLPADQFAAEVALAQAADKERHDEAELLLQRIGANDTLGIGRILALLRLLLREV
jgi:hypothetical protein